MVETPKKTSRKPTAGEPKEDLSDPIQVRLFMNDQNILEDAERSGLSMADLVRRCVKKSLPDVILDIQKEIEAFQKKAKGRPTSASQ